MRKIRWEAELTKERGVVEVDDDATDDDIWSIVDDEARQHFCTDWKDDER